MGIQDDAKLQGNDYSWLGTILYMGVLVGEYPTNLLLQKLPVAKYLAVKCVIPPAKAGDWLTLAKCFSLGDYHHMLCCCHQLVRLNGGAFPAGSV